MGHRPTSRMKAESGTFGGSSHELRNRVDDQINLIKSPQNPKVRSKSIEQHVDTVDTVDTVETVLDR